uniref:Uncharacterized protein n=1 Tax=Hydatigena taeniaeformis TaxID=6205 RepID=A0A0R3XBG2_HYDTA
LCASVESKPEEKGMVSEKLVLRLQREHRLDGAISLQEVSRTRSTDIALNAYLARRQASVAVEAVGEDAPGAGGAATITTSGTSKVTTQEGQRHLVPPRAGNSTAVRLDLRGVGRQLANGVTFEAGCLPCYRARFMTFRYFFTSPSRALIILFTVFIQK